MKLNCWEHWDVWDVWDVEAVQFTEALRKATPKTHFDRCLVLHELVGGFSTWQEQKRIPSGKLT